MPGSAKVRDFKDLLVWQKGMQLATQIYHLTKSFPSGERFGLISQLRRAAVSISSNLAEGQARRTTGEFIQFISQAEGSLAELETQLLLSMELGYSTSAAVSSAFSLITELQKMLYSLRSKLSPPR